MIEDRVILVDELDNPIGEMGKMEAHERGKLHRAFSVFILNTQGEMLIHQRALNKYHSAGLWTNACCSHPRPGETTLQAANRRLKEEMGIEAELTAAFQFRYFAEFENGLIEHELDHVFLGYSEEVPKPDSDEVENFKWITFEELLFEISEFPEKYTVWFRQALPKFIEFVETGIEKN